MLSTCGFLFSAKEKVLIVHFVDIDQLFKTKLGGTVKLL